MKNFVLIFIFNSDLTKVLLETKKKPEWQAGFLNGVGGKIEDGETRIEATIREIEEETTLVVKENDLKSCGTLHGRDGEVYIFTTIYRGNEEDAHMNDYEELAWYPKDQLPEHCISNLFWLVPLAHEIASGKMDVTQS